jgi:hypothetical protein
LTFSGLSDYAGVFYHCSKVSEHQKKKKKEKEEGQQRRYNTVSY